MPRSRRTPSSAPEAEPEDWLGDPDAELELTDREAEVMALLLQGMTNREIADALHLSHWTVKRHLSRISRRLGLGRRVELALWYADHLEGRFH